MSERSAIRHRDHCLKHARRDKAIADSPYPPDRSRLLQPRLRHPFRGTWYRSCYSVPVHRCNESRDDAHDPLLCRYISPLCRTSRTRTISQKSGTFTLVHVFANCVSLPYELSGREARLRVLPLSSGRIMSNCAKTAFCLQKQKKPPKSDGFSHEVYRHPYPRNLLCVIPNKPSNPVPSKSRLEGSGVAVTGDVPTNSRIGLLAAPDSVVPNVRPPKS